MKPVLIIEKCTNGLSLLENTNNEVKRKEYRLGGVFTEFDVKNRNERVYTASKFIPHLDELNERKKTLGVIYGEFDHPDVFDTSLSRVSHTVESVFFNKELNRVEGEIKLLSTYFGKEARALVDDGCPLFVSSRAAGVTESNGVVNLKKLFTYDTVADPGFSSAKMEIRSINESLGFNENANFRIYDLSDETKTNELFEMNKNENVTRQQMIEYSNYLVDEIEKIRNQINETLKVGGVDQNEVQKILEYYENLNGQQSKVIKYLDYLAESIQVTVNENKQLKEKTELLVEYNNYLATELEKSIEETEKVNEKVDKSINYSEYIAEKLSKAIDFTEYIAENVDNSIKYSEYIAEKLDQTISYSEYIAEGVEDAVRYSEYLAENLDNTIKYSEYVAEGVERSIKYSEYIAEGVTDTQAYTAYLSDVLDQTITMVKESKINESVDNSIDFKSVDVKKYYEAVEDEEVQEVQPVGQIQVENPIDEEPVVEEPVVEEPVVEEPVVEEPVVEEPVAEIETEITITDDEPVVVVDDKVEILPGMIVKVGEDQTGEVLSSNPINGVVVVKLDSVEEPVTVQESQVTILGDKIFESEKELKQNISKLIAESKKRKALAEQEPHFVYFLSESAKAAYYKLSIEDKEKVNVVLNENNSYTTEREVLSLMREALEGKKKTNEDLLVESLPTDLIPVWEKLENKVKEGILAQSKLYGNLTASKEKMESFWNTRDLESYLTVNKEKTLINESKVYVDNTKLSQEEIDRFISVFKKI